MAAIGCVALLFVANLMIHWERSNDRDERAVGIFLLFAGLVYAAFRPRPGGFIAFGPQHFHYAVEIKGDIKYETLRKVETKSMFGDRMLSIDVVTPPPAGNGRTGTLYIYESQLEPEVSLLHIQELLEMGRQGGLLSLGQTPPTLPTPPSVASSKVGLLMPIAFLTVFVALSMVMTAWSLGHVDRQCETLDEGPLFLVGVPLIALYFGGLFGPKRARRFFMHTMPGVVIAIFATAYGAIGIVFLVNVANQTLDRSPGQDVVYVFDGAYRYGSRGNATGYTGHQLEHADRPSDDFQHAGIRHLSEAKVGDRFCMHLRPGFFGARWVTDGCANFVNDVDRRSCAENPGAPFCQGLH